MPDFLMNSCSAAMASRRSKDKHPTIDTTKQLIKQELASPVTITNCFTTLSTIPKPNYSTVLASSFDPYAMVLANQPIKATFSQNPNAFQYVKKQYFQNWFSIEPNRAMNNDPLKLATNYFPLNFPNTMVKIKIITLLSCFMKNWSLSNPYLIRLINQKLFVIVFSSSMLLLKKNGDSILLL